MRFRKKLLSILKDAYGTANGKYYTPFSAAPLFEKLSIEYDEKMAIEEYLENHELLKFRAGDTFEITAETYANYLVFKKKSFWSNILIKWFVPIMVGIIVSSITIFVLTPLSGIINFYPDAIKKSKSKIQKNDSFQCIYLSTLKIGTDIKTIEKELSLPVPLNTLMGNSFYKDRIFEYVIPEENRIVRIGLTNSQNDTLKFNGDYEVRWTNDTCSKWTDRPAPCDTIQLLNREFVEHDYDGGAALFGIYCIDELVHIRVEIGVSRGFYKQDYFMVEDKLIKVKEIQEVFPYVDSIGTLDYSLLNREYEVLYEIQSDGIKKLDEEGAQTLGRKMTDKQKYEEYKSRFKEYRIKIEEKKVRARKDKK